MRRNRPYWLLALAGLVWLLLIASVPLLGELNRDGAAGIVGQAFGHICHQRPERSFAPLGRPLPVCARCLGLYLGLPAGLLLLPLAPGLASRLDRRPRLMILFAVPMFLDLLLSGDQKLIRLTTGLLASLPISFFLWRGLSELRSSPLLRSLR